MGAGSEQTEVTVSGGDDGAQGTLDMNRISPFQLVRDAYTGFGGFRNGEYLVRHKRETEFATRKGFSYYINLFAPILDSLVDPIFERAPARAGGTELWAQFLSNCDRLGTPLTAFMKTAAFKARRDGSAWLILDNVAQVPETLGEAEQARAFPYVYLKEAAEIVYWKIAKGGELDEIAFAEPAGATVMGKECPQQYRLWTKKSWAVFAKCNEGKLEEPVATGEHGLGRLPVVPIYTTFKEPECPVPHPPLYQIAVLNTAIYNLSSEIRSLQRSQGFSILIIPTIDGKFPSNLKIGASNALAVPETSKFLPQFVSPDVAVLQPYFDERKFLIESIYRQAKLAGVTGVVETSGVSKAWDFRATNVALSQLARAIEDAEKLLALVFGAWTSAGEMVVSSSYPEDFGVVDLDGEITQAQAFIDLGYPPEVVALVKSRVLSYYFKNLSPEDVKALQEKVEQAGDDELQSGADKKERAAEDAAAMAEAEAARLESERTMGGAKPPAKGAAPAEGESE